MDNVPYVDVTVPLTKPKEQRLVAVRELMGAMNESAGWNTEEVKKAIDIEPYCLGMTNELYRCQLGDEDLDVEKKDMKVMVRVYGEGTGELLDRDDELSVMTQVEEDYVKCRFANGIVVTFFEGECLRPPQLTEPGMKQKIAAKMAQLHKVVLCRADTEEPLQRSAFHHIEEWLSLLDRKKADFSREVKGLQEPMTPALFRRLYEELKAEVDKRGYENTCSHGDINAENCIYNDKNDTISFIDYEYAGNFFRGFDIGNHFCEYAGVERNLDFDTYYPSEEARREFVVLYCEAAVEDEKERPKRVEELLEEAALGAQISNLLWAIWGVVQHGRSTLEYDFLAYADARISEFVKRTPTKGGC